MYQFGAITFPTLKKLKEALNTIKLEFPTPTDEKAEPTPHAHHLSRVYGKLEGEDAYLVKKVYATYHDGDVTPMVTLYTYHGVPLQPQKRKFILKSKAGVFGVVQPRAFRKKDFVLKRI